MVDFSSYLRYGPGSTLIGELDTMSDIQECKCDDCAANPKLVDLYKPYYDDPKDDWEDLQYQLCPPRVLGYVLKDKQWVQLAVDGLKEIPGSANRKALDSLHLAGPDEGRQIKELLSCLIHNHSTGDTELIDIVPEKGKGLVILLYGEPGVGKTSTGMSAENYGNLMHES